VNDPHLTVTNAFVIADIPDCLVKVIIHRRRKSALPAASLTSGLALKQESSIIIFIVFIVHESQALAFHNIVTIFVIEVHSFLFSLRRDWYLVPAATKCHIIIN
jgi:hypothetical protein